MQQSIFLKKGHLKLKKKKQNHVLKTHGKADVCKEAENHTLDLYELSRSNDFAKQLQLVESLENWLKTCFPNQMFCSYFLYSKTMTSKFCFHMEYPNMDWISDRKVKSSNDCIRKNTF